MKTILYITTAIALEGLSLYAVLGTRLLGADPVPPAAAQPYVANAEQSCRATNLSLSSQIAELQKALSAAQESNNELRKHELQAEICSSAHLGLNDCIIESKDGQIVARAKVAAPAAAPAATPAPAVPTKP